MLSRHDFEHDQYTVMFNEMLFTLIAKSVVLLSMFTDADSVRNECAVKRKKKSPEKKKSLKI